jgi:hypothetical protein
MATQTPQIVGKNCLEFGVLVEDANGGANPPKSELDAWITSANSPNSWVLNSQNPQPELEGFFNTPRDFWMMVDLSTMKIMTQSNDDGPQAIADLQTQCN